MTFEQFQASRTEMTSHAFGKLVDDMAWDDEPPRDFLVYAGAYFIERMEVGYSLLIEREEWSTNDDGLRTLEERLYQWVLDEDFDPLEDE